MSQIPFNQTFKQQQQRLVRATFKKAFINAVHVSASTVDVAYAENPQTVIRNVPAAKSIDLSTIFVGQRCRVDLYDETNPTDCVLAYVY